MKQLALHSPYPMSQKFEFVNFHKPVKEQDAASKRRVREGAMKAFRRRERLQRIEVFQKTKTSSEISSNGQGFVSFPAPLTRARILLTVLEANLRTCIHIWADAQQCDSASSICELPESHPIVSAEGRLHRDFRDS